MARLLATAGLAALLLAGCSTTDTRYQNRDYGYNDGYSRPYPTARPYPYPTARPYPYPAGRPYYADRDADRYYRHDDDDRRLVKPERNVVCDRKTDVCYKKGDIDASETRDYFGNKAGQRVDKVRDKYDNNDIFVPRKNVVCDRDDKVCYNQGDPSVTKTRDYFGNRAAKRVDNDDDDDNRKQR